MSISIKRLFSLIIYFPLAIIFRIFSIKIPYFHTERIGHLVVDPESFLKAYFLKNQKFPRCILLAPINKTANQKLLDYWKKYFFVIKNKFFCRFLSPLCFHPLLKSDEKFAASIDDTSSIYSINAKWADKEPLLSISKEDLKFGKNALLDLGLNNEDWFVCVHSRDRGYSPSDEHLHSFRNTNIEDYLEAIEYIISKGGKCIRMGDSTMRPAPKLNGLIDYALSPFKSEQMDIFLCSQCLFFLGGNSGIFELSSLFGRPVAIANMAPMSIVARGSEDISIPMNYADEHSGELIDYKSIMESSKSNYRTSNDFIDAGISLIPNTPYEIKELAEEQFLKINNAYKSNDEDIILQHRYKAMFRPGHYGYGFSSKIGEKFLKRYSRLIP